MNLDLQKPTLVIAGNWNSAIFDNAGWLLQHIYGVPAGEEVEVGIAIQKGTPGKQVMMLNDIGFSADSNRIEFYLNKVDEDVLGRTEQMVANIVEVLPHTPIGAFGCNFLFVEENPEDVVIDRLKTNDGIHERYNIKEQIFKSIIEFEQNIDLTFTVLINNNATVTFDFNYHHVEINAANLAEKVNGAINRYKEHALDLINSLYDIEGFETVTILPGIEKKKEKGANE